MWNELWESHRGKVVGVAAGIFFGFIYLFFGFWDMLIFGFIVLVGFYVGNKVDRKESFVMLEDIWRYLTQKWRMFR
ncbi:DUF2273 domain-containing protein [Paenibacillus sp. GCM10023248]|uniref:DUF2273 domain-containing protein n=1 Tax=Bacillales TaxID=1385 RepID=UPI00237851BA|nr:MULTISPECIES: DUF2273 domain-containing protein [Bacillales]MDD9267521.1 DUF2273 domain-containing protein [Paenibacillus sp. MAHUQ-63]MDR6882739.1 putative membrane protein [Bacillus sp. 3255]